MKATENHHVPLDEIAQDLNNTNPYLPIFQVMFVFQKAMKSQFEINNTTFEIEENYNNTSKYELLLNIEEHTNHLKCDLEYDSQLYSKETIEKWIEYFKVILEEMVEGSKKVKDINMLSQEEINILKTFTQGEKQPISKETLNQIFEKQASISPYKEALVYKDETLNYKELNEKANI
ncbi:condensation domain-containing protein, partial [Staphylococcus xylosus]|uniref:condensation domain-containing protein n=3 Tax=Staphylococcus xylosus TaxID=1288 RepID=UPI003F5583ED